MSFNKNSGPGTRNHNQQPSFGNQPPPPPSSSWFNGGSVNPGANQSGSVAPAVPSHNQDLKRTRSPPALSTYKEVLQNSTTFPGSHLAPQRTKSPLHVYQRNQADKKGFGPLSETKRLSTRLDNSHVWPQPSADLYKPEARATNQSDLPVPKRSRLPFSTLDDPGLRRNNSSVLDDSQSHFVPQRSKSSLHVYQRNHPDKGFVPSSETKRPSVYPPRLSTRIDYSDVWTQPYTDLDKPDAPATNLTHLPVPKPSSSPFPTLNEPGLRGNNTSVVDDTQRELQAKAKRMARFKNELSQPDPNETGNRNQKPQQQQQQEVDQRKIKGEASDMNEDQDSSSTVIIGYCADMCPEQERAERERKGDLDQYERLDGDRNQTTESLAVKKYTRTAEREAALIRPMEILQKTIDYLLKLLDQPYDEKFLGLYNFLWDRMRAVRMDLRMQHIFNLGAITMLEQMIRLHIIAMHELCEYTKGEGFSEGFDAHLNIEQMNKTSVELFQLYDDHRKKGINVPTETEFRGYYALLKLDKHPGYKVEPSELSLDLAKMTTRIRQAADVLFARNVARACRTGNFVAFFRLVRKASYLQACLMHAHFGKLRTLALASLHSGLQINQGIPLSQVAKWLGMEEENMEDLLEYHGFCIKEFDEAYMVKGGQFLNLEKEYPLKCSKLVHLKRSTTVVQDVFSSPLITSFTPNDPKVDHLSMQEKSTVNRKETIQIFPKPVDNKTTDFGSILSVKNDMHLQPIFTTPVVASSSPRDIFKNINSPKSPKSVEKPSLLERKFRNSLEKQQQSNIFTKVPHVAPEKVVVEETLPDVRMDSFVEEDLKVQPVFLQNLETENVIQEMPNENENENENEMDTSVDEEVAQAKLKLIFRLWRRRAFIKKELREKRQLAANAALSSLSLGPPMWHYKEQIKAPVDFNIDRAMCERYEKQEQLWSTLNVSNIVAPTLGQLCKYPKLICWKLLFCSLDQGSWLQHKLMPENIGYDDDDLIASSPNVSIWKKLDYKKPPNDWTCYITVVKNVQSDNLIEETVFGASAVMFLASEGISWEAQKTRLFNLISLVPHGSCLPLLILSGSKRSTVVENLGVNEVDKSKISCFSVVPLDDGYLTNGLEWLASQSPLQPVVSRVKTRELILKNLKVMQFDDSHNTTPEQCISVINEAVEESVKEVNQAAKSNPVCWPCPEISLLNGPDFSILESYLPSAGWSSGARIGCLIEVLRNCKLPNITNNLSRCCNNGIEVDIEKQKVELEQFLVSYLSPILGLQLAQNETLILIQKCVGLELCGRSYYLVPKWAMILRRVFNWQLMSLSNGSFSTAYVLDRNASVSLSFAEEESYNKLMSPSLDEMIQVCCFQSGPERGPGPSLEVKAAVCEDEMVVCRNNQVEEEMNYVENENTKSYDNDNERSLSWLLEKCCIVQDIIDQKLSVYF